MNGTSKKSLTYQLTSFAPVFAVLYLPWLRFSETSIYVGTIYLLLFMVYLVVARRTNINPNFLLAIIVLNIINLISFAISGFVLDDFVITTLQYNFFLIFLLVFYSNPPTGSRRIYFAAIMFPVLYGLILFYVTPANVLTFGRFSSIFDNPNAAGMFFVSVTGVLFALTFESTFARTIRAICIAAVILAIVLTGSFGSIFAFFCVAFFAAFCKFGRAKLSDYLKVCFIAGTASAILYLVYYIFSSRYGVYVTDFDFRAIDRLTSVILGDSTRVGSLDERNLLNAAALRRILESPDLNLFGFGFGQGRYSFSIQTGNFTPVHNVILSLVLDLGWLGLIVYSYIFFLFYSKFCASKDDRIVFFAFFIGFLLTPAVYLPFYWVPTVFYFAIKNDKSSAYNIGSGHWRR